MKIVPCLPVLLWLLCGCAPHTSAPVPAGAVPGAGAAPSANAATAEKSASSTTNGPSYEVSIASAEADRVQARDLCDSKGKGERQACLGAADAAYDQAKSAAESARNTL